MMTEKIFSTHCGDIHYWVNEHMQDRLTLVFLPGLTADHRLFEKQLECFEGRYNVLVWDAPGHAASRPFSLHFSLADKARWLNEILNTESIIKPVIIGQSMGGYVGQAYIQEFPGSLRGYISIDSAPLGREYSTSAELWMLKRTEPIYRFYPWKQLVSAGAKGTAESEYGRKLMRDMMLTYDDDHGYYARLVSHGYSMLARAIEADLSYSIDCPAILLCGDKDRAGSTKRYNIKWNSATGIPLVWVKNAGHNSNTDKPEAVNNIIQTFLRGIKS